MFVKKIRISVF